MHRRDLIATALAGLLLFGLGLSGMRSSAEDTADWLASYNEAMNPPTYGP